MTMTAATPETPAVSSSWPVWSTTARVVVTDPSALAAAVEITQRLLAEVDRAASRFRPDSEVSLLAGGPGTARISPLLADLLATALLAAERTDGDVDPTVGAVLVELGYHDEHSLGRSTDRLGGFDRVCLDRRVRWTDVELGEGSVRVPAGTLVDLGATAKAYAADRAAALVAEGLGTGVLVELGGDIATAGPAPSRGWTVDVQDLPRDPATRLTLGAGSAIATSSTQRRTWWRAGERLHHVLDPRTGMPADSPWASVTVVAGDCVAANTLTTAALVRGASAPSWLAGLGAKARLVTHDGRVLRTAAWPKDAVEHSDRPITVEVAA